MHSVLSITSRLLCSITLLAMLCTGCNDPPHRFDCYPAPLSTRTLIPLGLHNDPTAWSCVDKAHDDYLEEWKLVMADDAARLSELIRSRSNPFEGGDLRNWLADLQTVESFEKRHANIMIRLETLDAALLDQWSTCLGAQWGERMEAMRIDRSILRWRGVAEANGPSMLDLRLMIPALALNAAQTEQLRDGLREYARAVQPLARKLAEARLHLPVVTIHLREQALAKDGKVDEKVIVANALAKVQAVHDLIIRLDLNTIESLRGTLPDTSLDRLRDAVVNAMDRRRPRYGNELLAPVAAELTTIAPATRALIRKAIDQHAAADGVLRDQIAQLAMRDPQDSKLQNIREQRALMLVALNTQVIEALPPEMRDSMKQMQREGVANLRSTLETILDPAVASRFERELPEPEPADPPRRLPIRTGNDVLGQLLPSDFAAWAEIRIPTLAQGDPDRSEPMRLLISDAREAWSAELANSLARLQPMQKLVEAGIREPITLSELQRRLRMAVAELDAARSRLQLIEDPVLQDAAAIMNFPMDDPRVERLRLERAAEFAGLGWRDMPVQAMFQLDLEATIDLPTVIDELQISSSSRAIADMALVDNAVPIIESAELLRQSCVQALRSLVLEIKRAMLREVPENKMGALIGKIVKSAAVSIGIAAEMRIQVQQTLLTEICAALPPADARALRRAYWCRAYPELYMERKPVGVYLNQLLEGLPALSERRAMAEAILEGREQAIDDALPSMIQARKRYPTEAMKVRRETFTQIEREAPILGFILRLREEIDARALRSLASLHDNDPAAWQAVIDWGGEHPFSFEGLNQK